MTDPRITGNNGGSRLTALTGTPVEGCDHVVYYLLHVGVRILRQTFPLPGNSSIDSEGAIGNDLIATEVTAGVRERPFRS